MTNITGEPLEGRSKAEAAVRIDQRAAAEFQSSMEPDSNVTPLGHNPVVVLACPHEGYRSQLRRAVEAEGATIAAVCESYPGYAQLAAVLEPVCDAYIVEVDTDQEVALDLVETICSRKPTSTVMVYSATHDQTRMISAMRAGAREFLSGSVPPRELHAALVRATVRNADQGAKKPVGKTIVFWSAKGGSGVSTLAANFAVALRMETAAPVLLADFNPQLGDLSVLLGVTPRFTVAEAFRSARRLDAQFLSTLVAEHNSGISFIAAPDTYGAPVSIEDRAVAKLVDVARGEYPWIVIDAGPSLGAGVDAVFQMANVIYVVTQVDVPSLHSTNRFISYMKAAGGRQIEVVLNRYDPRRSELGDERVAKALGVAPKWKIPNDYAAAHRAANTGNMLIHEKTPIAYALRALARSASGKPLEQSKKRGAWSLFG